jgi:hypothetical protein
MSKKNVQDIEEQQRNYHQRCAEYIPPTTKEEQFQEDVLHMHILESEYMERCADEAVERYLKGHAKGMCDDPECSCD